jgi:hypothetical protein
MTQHQLHRFVDWNRVSTTGEVFQLVFEEKPILRAEDGATCGMIDGRASIVYWRDKSWSIVGIHLCCLHVAVDGSVVETYVPAPQPIAEQIARNLLQDESYCAYVDEKVDEMLERDREGARVAAAEFRMSA